MNRMATMRRMRALPFLAVLLAVLTVAAAQSSPPSASDLPPCLQNLLNCTEFIMGISAAPSELCCTKAHIIFENQLDCTCPFLNDSSVMTNAGLNYTRIMEIPKDCNVNFDLASNCTAGINLVGLLHAFELRLTIEKWILSCQWKKIELASVEHLMVDILFRYSNKFPSTTFSAHCSRISSTSSTKWYAIE